jgi:hypothetical protein
MIRISLKTLFVIGLFISWQTMASDDFKQMDSMSGSNLKSENYCRLLFYTHPMNAAGILQNETALFKLDPTKVKPLHPSVLHSLLPISPFDTQVQGEKGLQEDLLNFLVFGNPKSKDNTHNLHTFLRNLRTKGVQLTVDLQTPYMSLSDIEELFNEPEYRERLNLLHLYLHLPIIPMVVDTHAGSFEYSGLRNIFWNLFIYSSSNRLTRNDDGMSPAWYALADRRTSTLGVPYEIEFRSTTVDISKLADEELFIFADSKLHPTLVTSELRLGMRMLSILDFAAILILESEISSTTYLENAKYLAKSYPDLRSQKAFSIPQNDQRALTQSLIQRLITYAENYRQYLLDSNPSGLVPIAEPSLADLQKEADVSGQSLENFLKEKLIEANKVLAKVYGKSDRSRFASSSDSFFTGWDSNTHFIKNASETSSPENLLKQLHSTLRYTEEARRSIHIENIRKPSGPFSSLRGFIRRDEYQNEKSIFDLQSKLHRKLNELDHRIHQLKELSDYLESLD